MTIETKDITLVEDVYENYISTYKKGSLVGTNDNDIIRADLSGYEPIIKNDIKNNKGLTISAGKGDDIITGTQYNDKISGGIGSNIINLSTKNYFGNDTVVLSKNEQLKFLLDIDGANIDEYLNYYIKGKNLVIEVFDEEGIQKGSVTISNYTKKDILGVNGSLGIYDKNDELIVNLRAFKYQTVFIDENTKTSKITGTWINDFIDGSEYQLYQDKKRTIPIDTCSKKGLTINAGAGDNEITGSKYSDTIKSSNGSDLIHSTQGNDKYTLGKGNDTIIYNGEFNTDTYILTKGESLSFDFDFYDLTSLNDIKFSLVGKDLQISIPCDDGIYGKIVLKNYTKNILKDLNIKIDNNGYKSFANLGELLDLVTLKYDISDSNKKGVITASQYDDVIDISNNEKKITINAGKGNNIIRINNTTSFGNIILSEQKVSATNTIIFDDIAELSFTKSGTNLIISDNNGKLTINGYFGKIKNKSTINIVSDDKLCNMEDYLKDVALECVGKGKLYGTDNDDVIIATGNATIYTGKGDDVVLSSKGNRTFYFNEGDGNDVIEKGTGVDTIRFAKGTKVTASLEYNIDGSANLILSYGNQGDTVTLMNYDSKKTSYYVGSKKYSMSSVIKNGNHIEIDKYMTHYDGTNDNDVIIDSLIHSSYDKITINAGDGDDYIDAHNDIVYGGNGNDYIHAKDCIVFGGDGNDTIVNYNSSSKNIYIYGGNGDDVIVNNQYASIDYIYGEDGDDKIINNGEVRVNIDAGDGNNEVVISGTVGNDVISGNGNDKIKIEKGGTVKNISSGDGNDTIIVEGTVSGKIDAVSGDNTITVSGSTGDINTNSGNNTIIVSGSAKKVVTGNGDDTIDVSGSVNSIDAGDGNNEVIISGNVANDVISGEGNDTVIVKGTVNNIDLGAGNDSIIVEDGAEVKDILSGDGDNVITISGTVNSVDVSEGSDTITLNETASIKEDIHGNGGNDVININNNMSDLDIYGDDGDDIITISEQGQVKNVYGGLGDDTINISGIVNNVDAGSGDNEITVLGTVSNNVISGNGSDTIIVSGSVNNINSGSGNDEIVISGKVLNDIDTGVGNDNITIQTGAEVSGSISGGLGNDTYIFYSGSGIKTIVDTSGSNILSFADIKISDLKFEYDEQKQLFIKNINNPDDVVIINKFESKQFDKLIALDENGESKEFTLSDYIYLRATEDENIIVKDDENYIAVYGDNDDNNIVVSGTVTDIYSSGGNNDITITENGTIYNDILCGSGDDTITVLGTVLGNIDDENGDNTVTVLGSVKDVIAGQGNDTIDISGSVNSIDAGDGNNEVIISGNVANDVISGNGNDSIVVENGGTIKNISSGDGDDEIIVEGRVSNIDGGNGDNTITLSGYANRITVGAGNDTITLNKDSSIQNDIHGNDGNDVINIHNKMSYKDVYGDNGDDTITISEQAQVRNVYGGDGNDNIIVEGIVNSINAGNGNNIITVSGSAKDVTSGNDSDTITITGSVNSINAGSGNDEITIKSGAFVSGTISGGLGDDTYIFYSGSGTKTISDTSGVNKLVFADAKITDFELYCDKNNRLIIKNINNPNDIIYIQNFNSASFSRISVLDENNEEKEYSIQDLLVLKGTLNDDTFVIENYKTGLSIDAGDGNDTITVLGSAVNINAGAGNNEISIETGANVLGTILCGNGNDTINISGTVNSVNVDNGDNEITVSGTVSNNVTSGNGSDTIIVSGSVNNINSGSGNNEITIKSEAFVSGTISSGSGDDNINVFGTVNSVNAGSGDNEIVVTGTVSNNVISGSNNDEIVIKTGANVLGTILSGSGDDTINISGSVNSIDAGDGNNEVIISGNVTNDVISGNDNDSIIVENGGIVKNISSGDGDDEIVVEGTVSGNINSAGGDNIIRVSGLTKNITTGTGNDIITISGSVDSINAVAGNDNIIIQTGAKVSGTISGGLGDDTYIFYSGSGTKTISDSSGINTLMFADAKINDLKFEYDEQKQLFIKNINNPDDVVIIKDFSSEQFDKLIALDENGEEKEYSISDYVYLRATGMENITVNSDENYISVDGDNSDNTITISGTVTDIYSDGGSDSIIIQNGANVFGTIYGGDGDDTYIFYSGSGTKTISDTSGVNKLVFADAKIADLQIRYNQQEDKLVIENKNSKDILNILNFFEFKFDELYALNNIGELKKYLLWEDNLISSTGTNGTPYNDIIRIENSIINRNIYAYAGNDNITISASRVYDVITDSGNNNIIVCNSWMDDILCGDGNDTIIIQESNDMSGFIDEWGEEIIYDYTSINNIDAGNGNNSITINGETYISSILCGDGKDEINITNKLSGSEYLNELGNYALISTGDGDDIITISGSIERDGYYGDDGENYTATIISSGDGDDNIIISGSINFIDQYLNDKADKIAISAGSGNDNIVIKNGASIDGIIDGGTGDDTYTFYMNSGTKTISDSSGNETLIFADAKFSDLEFDYYDDNNVLKIINKNLPLENLNMQDIVNINNFMGSGFDKIIALDENDEEKEYSIFDYIYNGTNSDDIITINEDENYLLIQGNDGDDVITINGNAKYVKSGCGNDIINIENNLCENCTYIFNVGDGNDVISGFSENDTFKINGINIDDIIYTVSGDDLKISYTENDSIILKDYLLTAKNLNIKTDSGNINLLDRIIINPNEKTFGNIGFGYRIADGQTLDDNQYWIWSDGYYPTNKTYFNTNLRVASKYASSFNSGGIDKTNYFSGSLQDGIVYSLDFRASEKTLNPDIIHGYSIITAYLPTMSGQKIDTSKALKYLIGGNTNNILVGTDDYRYISGGKGDDYLYGGYNNTFLFSNGDGYDTIYKTNSSDTINISSQNQTDLLFTRKNNDLEIGYNFTYDDNLGCDVAQDFILIKDYYTSSSTIENIVFNNNKTTISAFLNENSESNEDTISYVSENQINELNQCVTAWTADSFDSSENIIDTYANNFTNLEPLVPVQ